MIELVKCPRESCGRVQFEVDESFTGGVIAKCHRCKRFLKVHSASDVEVLDGYESPNVATFTVHRPAANSAQRNAR